MMLILVRDIFYHVLDPASKFLANPIKQPQTDRFISGHHRYSLFCDPYACSQVLFFHILVDKRFP